MEGVGQCFFSTALRFLFFIAEILVQLLILLYPYASGPLPCGKKTQWREPTYSIVILTCGSNQILLLVRVFGEICWRPPHIIAYLLFGSPDGIWTRDLQCDRLASTPLLHKTIYRKRILKSRRVVIFQPHAYATPIRKNPLPDSQA